MLHTHFAVTPPQPHGASPPTGQRAYSTQRVLTVVRAPGPRPPPSAGSRTSEAEEVAGRRPEQAADGTAAGSSTHCPPSCQSHRDFSPETTVLDAIVPPPRRRRSVRRTERKPEPVVDGKGRCPPGAGAGDEDASSSRDTDVNCQRSHCGRPSRNSVVMEREFTGSCDAIPGLFLLPTSFSYWGLNPGPLH